MDKIAEIKEKEIKPLLREAVRIVRKYVPDGSYHILLFGSWPPSSNQGLQNG